MKWDDDNDDYEDIYFIGKLQKRKWENAMTIDTQSWGYRREATLKDMLNMTELIKTFVVTVRYTQLQIILS